MEGINCKQNTLVIAYYGSKKIVVRGILVQTRLRSAGAGAVSYPHTRIVKEAAPAPRTKKIDIKNRTRTRTRTTLNKKNRTRTPHPH